MPDPQSRMTASYDAEAAEYEEDPGYRIADSVLPHWRKLLDPEGRGLAGLRILDVGAGTGVLSRILADLGAEVTARQSVCCLHDPAQAFRNWRLWLKPGGEVLIVDGFWGPAEWNDPALAGPLPLSSLTSCEPAAALLREAGFEILETCVTQELSAEGATRYALRALRSQA